MKAVPVRIEEGKGFTKCEVEEASHVMINVPGPSGIQALPFILKGSREGTHKWTWNGDSIKPTLKPSLLITTKTLRCHSFVNDGMVRFLNDSNHEHANQTLELLEVPKTMYK